MWHGQGLSFLREVEHVEDNGLLAAVLAVVDGADHLDDGFALVDDFLGTVDSDDGQLALHQHGGISYFTATSSGRPCG